MGKVLAVLCAVPVLLACGNYGGVACFELDRLGLVDDVSFSAKAEEDLVAGVDVKVVL